MGKKAKQTIALLVGVASLLIGWDIYVAVNDESGDTISEIFLFFSSHPILPAALGILVGHLVWPQRIKDKDGKDEKDG